MLGPSHRIASLVVSHISIYRPGMHYASVTTITTRGPNKPRVKYSSQAAAQSEGEGKGNKRAGQGKRSTWVVLSKCLCYAYFLWSHQSRDHVAKGWGLERDRERERDWEGELSLNWFCSQKVSLVFFSRFVCLVSCFINDQQQNG